MIEEINEKEKDFSKKIEILKHYLIKEKQKSSSLEEENRSLKSEIESLKFQTNHCKTFIQPSNLTLEEFSNKITPSQNLTKSFSSAEECENYFIELELQNGNLKEMLNEATSSISIIKTSFQKLISELQNKNRILEENISSKIEEITNLNKQSSIITSQIKTNDVTIQNLENKVKNLEEENLRLKEKHSIMIEKTKEESEKDVQYEESFIMYSKMINELKMKIEKMKEVFLNENFEDRSFKGYKKQMMKNKKAVLTFTCHEGEISLSLFYEDDDVKKFVSIDNIEYVKVIDASNNQIEIKYYKRKGDGKPYIKSYILEENAEIFINTYKDFSGKLARLKMNKKLYESINF